MFPTIFSREEFLFENEKVRIVSSGTFVEVSEFNVKTARNRCSNCFLTIKFPYFIVLIIFNATRANIFIFSLNLVIIWVLVGPMYTYLI